MRKFTTMSLMLLFTGLSLGAEEGIPDGHLFRPGDGEMPAELLPDGFTLPN
jgi:hypothetical protein